MLAEHNGVTGAMVVNYIYAGNRMILSGPYYLLNDQLSARLLLNTLGAVKGRQAHLPFGEDFAETGPQQEKHHFTSYERDTATGADYAVNRTYSFNVGRFNSADPFQSSGDASTPQSWNRYAYVTNAPVDYIDPLGLLIAAPSPGDPCGSTPGPSGSDDPKPLKCTIEVYHRGIEAFHGLPIPGAKHGYIILRDVLGFAHLFEGQNEKKTGKLIAADTFNHGAALPRDLPLKDRRDGKTTGTEVCAWLIILEIDAIRVNAANIRYRGFGPNSNSVLRFMLQSLPDQTWYHMPFMIGWKSRLPGVE